MKNILLLGIFLITINANLKSQNYNHAVVDGELRVTSHDFWGALISIDATDVENGRNWWIKSLGGEAGEGQGKFAIHPLDATETEQYFLIEPNGNIGLGTNTPTAKLQIENGDVYLSDVNSGIIMKSPDLNCWRVQVENDGSFKSTAIACP